MLPVVIAISVTKVWRHEWLSEAWLLEEREVPVVGFLGRRSEGGVVAERRWWRWSPGHTSQKGQCFLPS